jgi:hypothetical protein
MPIFDFNSRFGTRKHQGMAGPEGVAPNTDLMMEQILENMHTTPIGQVLRRIASLPEVRQEKILDVRRQLTEGKYDLNERLDLAIEKVLENLST